MADEQPQGKRQKRVDAAKVTDHITSKSASIIDIPDDVYRSLTSINVLIVDDSPTVLKVVAEMLFQKGYYFVDVTTSSIEAIEKLKKKTYDIALIDINMPEISGLELSSRFRDFESKADILIRQKIIGMTSDFVETKMQDVIDAGMDSFLFKPFTIQKLEELFIMKDLLEEKKELLTKANMQVNKQITMLTSSSSSAYHSNASNGSDHSSNDQHLLSVSNHSKNAETIFDDSDNNKDQSVYSEADTYYTINNHNISNNLMINNNLYSIINNNSNSSNNNSGDIPLQIIDPLNRIVDDVMLSRRLRQTAATNNVVNSTKNNNIFSNNNHSNNADNLSLISSEISPTSSSSSSSSASSFPFSSLNILLVDDSPTILKIVSRMLEKAGHTVETKSSGLEGLNALLSKTYDCVLMDINMPQWGGLEVSFEYRIREYEKAQMKAHADRIALLAQQQQKQQKQQQQLQQEKEAEVTADTTASVQSHSHSLIKPSASAVATKIESSLLPTLSVARAGGNQRIIAMTGELSARMNNEVMSAGFDGLLMKPFTMEKFHSILLQSMK